MAPYSDAKNVMQNRLIKLVRYDRGFNQQTSLASKLNVGRHYNVL